MAGAASLAAALAAAQAGLDEAYLTKQRSQLDAMIARIQESLPQAVDLGVGADRLSNTSNIAYPGVKAQALHARLDLAAAISVGSAYMAPWRAEPCRSCFANDPALKGGNLHISIGHHTKTEDLMGFADAYVAAVQAMLTGNEWWLPIMSMERTHADSLGACWG